MAIPCDDYMHWQRTLSDQATSTVDTRWVELDELEILEWESSTNDHSISITRACVRACAAEVGSSISTSGENSFVCAEPVKSTVFHVHGHNTNTLSTFHDQVEGEVLDEEVGVVTEGLAVERVEESVASTVCRSRAAVGLATLAVLEGLATERPLVDLALLGS